MSDIRRLLVRVLGATVACALVAGLTVGSGAAGAKVPRTPHRYTAKIESLAPYVGQSICSPGAKPGTAAFATMLLRTYKSSRSLGISRSCSVGAASEHKEGRAFDWGVSVGSAQDRRSVQALFRWLLKTDRHGNRYAMARRLGIQYMIWNRRIWGAYAASSGWRRYTGANPHTDHVHFSLSWAGARKKTSFWSPRNFPNGSGNVPQPPRPTEPEPRSSGPRQDHPDPQPDSRTKQPRAVPEPRAPRTLTAGPALVHERVAVRTDRRAGTLTRGALAEGHRYLVEVSGTYRYDRRTASRADAECSAATRSGWQRTRSLRTDQWDADHLDLYVDGHDLYAQADDDRDCDTGGHTYRWVYQADRDGRVPLTVWDANGHADNVGTLAVRITDLERSRSTMAWTVPARAKAGVTSPGQLTGGEDYLVTVRGTWTDGRGVTADAECARTSRSSWDRRFEGEYGEDRFDVMLGTFGHDSLVPRLTDVGGEPAESGASCAEDHVYTFVWRADRTQPVNVRVDDPRSYADNTGALRVSVTPYVEAQPEPSPTEEPTPEPDPSEEPTPEPDPTEEPAPEPENLQVDSRSSSAVRTAQEFAGGTELRLTVTGAYLMRASSDWIAADAECTASAEEPWWRSTRFEGRFDGSWSPLGDLVVNRRLVSWEPADGRGSCDGSDAHEYSLDLTVAEDGPLWFVVADDYYDDNRGALTVTVEPR